jgi:carbon monoxide dehydrogenase subunit G
MLTIDTGFKTINAPVNQVFDFLSNVDNLKELMPEQVINWSGDADSCRYTIKGMADIGMRMQNREPHHTLHIKSDGKVPFEFSLNIKLESSTDAQCKVKLLFEADMNMMLRMMAEKPLTNFFNYQLSALEKKYN